MNRKERERERRGELERPRRLTDKLEGKMRNANQKHIFSVTTRCQENKYYFPTHQDTYTKLRGRENIDRLETSSQHHHHVDHHSLFSSSICRLLLLSLSTSDPGRQDKMSRVMSLFLLQVENRCRNPIINCP